MKKILPFLTFCIPTFLFGQGVGIGTLNPDTSAILELRSNNKGLLIPRMDSLQRLAIDIPAEGLIVYDNDKQAICYFDGVVWNCLGVGGSGIAGPAGPAGPTGATGLQGPAGPIGAIGPQGAVGPIGLNGPQGISGVNGIHCWDSNGNGLDDPTEDTNGDGLFNSGDCTQGVVGPQGPAGPIGATGPQGSAGPIGATGPQGPAGPVGATGPQGTAGPIGTTGPQGTAGPIGAIGPQGTTGPIGATGPQGIAGPIGATGPQGTAGPIGATGPQGPLGIHGINCWDANGNGTNDPVEDTNNDGLFNAADCKVALPLGQSAITLETSVLTILDNATLIIPKIIAGLSATITVTSSDIVLIDAWGVVVNNTNSTNSISVARMNIFIDGIDAGLAPTVASINESVGAVNILNPTTPFNIFHTKLLTPGTHTIDVRGNKFQGPTNTWVDCRVGGNLSIIKIKN